MGRRGGSRKIGYGARGEVWGVGYPSQPEQGAEEGLGPSPKKNEFYNFVSAVAKKILNWWSVDVEM